jgi:MoaA/NifB/PqqE/SkfB family radical SAM enzyme
LGDPAPFFATIFVTDRCNVRCDGCLFYETLHTDGSTRREDTATMLRILDALSEDGVPMLSYVGGEPFLREDLPEILRAGKTRGFSQGVVTNAMIDAPEIVAACEETCDAVVFSPHPPEELGGNGAESRWKSAWTGVRRLRSGLSRPELTVGITLGRFTAARLEEIIARSVDCGVDRIRCHPNFYPSQFPSADQLAEARRVLEAWTLKAPAMMDPPELFLNDLEAYFSDVPRMACTADRKFNVGVYLDGSVSACCPERVMIGNLLDTPLAQMRATKEQMRTNCFGCQRPDVVLANRLGGS